MFAVNDSNDNVATVDIEWGDGTAEPPITSGFGALSIRHDYPDVGSYTVRILAVDTKNEVDEKALTVEVSVPTGGLLAEYLFNRDPGDNRNVPDTSNNGNDGQAQGAFGCVTFARDRFDKRDSAYHFNDCARANGFGALRLPGTGARLNFDSTFTWTVWTRATKQGGGWWIVGQTSGPSGQRWARLEKGSQNVEFFLPGATSGQDLLIVDPEPLPFPDSREWVFYVVVVSYDGSSTLAQLYRNGEKVGEKSMDVEYSNPAPVDSTSDAIYVGNRGSNLNASSFPGLIDDVRIYNRPLSPQEIAAL